MSTPTVLSTPARSSLLAVAGAAALAFARLGNAQCGTNPASCYTVHTSSAGCNDAFCCNLVCVDMPSCCTMAWDAICVDIA